jgi:hypothetical protein
MEFGQGMTYSNPVNMSGFGNRERVVTMDEEEAATPVEVDPTTAEGEADAPEGEGDVGAAKEEAPA